MFFHKGYAIHGAYRHSRLGQPMSHGCVNMKIAEAEIPCHWAPVGILVVVQGQEGGARSDT